MDKLLLISLAMKLVVAVIAFGAVYAILQFLNGHADVKIRDHLDIIETSPIATAIYRAGLVLAMAVLIGLAMSGCTVAHAATYPKKYDAPIKSSVSTWLPYWPWKAVKAEWIAESNLNPEARSPVGAMGVAQFMPKTWSDVSKAMQWGVVDRRLAEPSIQAGAFYLARLRKTWSSPRPETERRRLAQASYNAGPGSLIAAQRLCGNPADYAAIAACLPRVTGAHAAETLNYVPRIERIWAELEAGL
jgi:hypothetical protein